jgi:hypothetical protein
MTARATTDEVVTQARADLEATLADWMAHQGEGNDDDE